MLASDCTDLFIKTFSFWSHLSEAEKKLLCDNTISTKFPKGTNLHSSTDDCIGVLLLKTGQLRTYILSEDGRDITLYRLFSGDVCILSASCILDAITFDIFIDAEVDTEALLVNAGTFRQLAEQNIYVQNFAYRLSSTRFSDVMWAMQQILFMSADRRLAIFLVDEMSKSDSTQLKLTHEQIARYMGSAREVVTRLLKYFSNEGIVKLSRGSVTILNKKKLRQLAQHP